MKAYMGGDSEGYATIHFAESRGKARQHFSNEYGIDFIDVQVNRAAYADPYANGDRIPRKVLLENGWWLECRCVNSHPMTEDDAVVIDDVVYCDECKHKAVSTS